MRHLKILAFVAVATLVAGGCATGGTMTEGEQLALYRASAKAPVDSFRYLGRIDGWTPLGDTALAVWTRPNEAYLLEISGPCPDLEFAMAIGLTHQSGRVYSRFDKVIPRAMGGGAQPLPCHIREIRPLDVKGLKAAQREQGEAGTGGTER